MMEKRWRMKASLRAAYGNEGGRRLPDEVLERMTTAALDWVVENFAVPGDEQIQEFYSGESEAGVAFEFLQRFAVWWGRKMFTDEDPLTGYVMRHFDDVVTDQRALRCRAEAAVADYREHVRRNGTGE